MDKRIVVPEGMIAAYEDRAIDMGLEVDPSFDYVRRECITAALKWLSENPIVPTNEQIDVLWDESLAKGPRETLRYCAVEWQRRMFLAPEPIVPEEVKDLLLDKQSHKDIQPFVGEINLRFIEAFNRGKKAARR